MNEAINYNCVIFVVGVIDSSWHTQMTSDDLEKNNCVFSHVSQELSKRLGRLIQGEMDQYNRGVIFTPAFVARHKARIRGLFSAITR